LLGVKVTDDMSVGQIFSLVSQQACASQHNMPGQFGDGALSTNFFESSNRF
jgi:hypothetical protein